MLGEPEGSTVKRKWDTNDEQEDTWDSEPLINAAFPSRLFTPTIFGLEDNYDQLFKHVHGMLSDPAADQVCWKALDGAAHRLLSALLRVSRDDIVPIVLEMPIVGYIRTLECIQIAANRGSVGGGSRFGSLAGRRRSAVVHMVCGDITTMARDSDVGYTLELLRISVSLMRNGTYHANGSERDLDVGFHNQGHQEIAACMLPQQREQQPVTFVANEAHGIEFAAAANVRANRSQTSKHICDRTGLLVLLKDIHRALVLRALSVRPSEQSVVREEMAKVPAVGILVNRFRFEWVALSYLNGGWYGATQIKALDAPVFDTEQFPSSFVAFVTAMLTFRNLLEGIVVDVTYLLQAENPLESDFTSSAKWMTTASERTHKRKKVILTDETRLSS
ncbi:hypothetical protein HDU85_001608 [Gaertneriomyces sp. JEL0708]|nr:hypothetical protein HDU85_001608 [Gaertneriomyces sp. JEL0708]